MKGNAASKKIECEKIVETHTVIMTFVPILFTANFCCNILLRNLCLCLAFITVFFSNKLIE